MRYARFGTMVVALALTASPLLFGQRGGRGAAAAAQQAGVPVADTPQTVAAPGSPRPGARAPPGVAPDAGQRERPPAAIPALTISSTSIRRRRRFVRTRASTSHRWKRIRRL